jgi:hypothetical protein
MYCSIEISLSFDITFTLIIDNTATAVTVTIGVGDYVGSINGLSINISAGNILLVKAACSSAPELGLWMKAIFNVTWT